MNYAKNINEFSVGKNGLNWRYSNFLLDCIVKNLSKSDSKYLSQEFFEEFLELVKQKRFYLYENLNSFEKFHKDLPCKEKFFIALNDRYIILMQKTMKM